MPEDPSRTLDILSRTSELLKGKGDHTVVTILEELNEEIDHLINFEAQRPGEQLFVVHGDHVMHQGAVCALLLPTHSTALDDRVRDLLTRPIVDD